jgi:hypothetical protein
MKRRQDTWSPFKRNGKFRVTFYTDPLPKRLLAWVRREPLWHQMGALDESV